MAVQAAGLITDTTGWAISDGKVWLTQDGGMAWQALNIPSADIETIAAADASNLLLARISGLDAVVDSSTDGGQHWREAALGNSGQPGSLSAAARGDTQAVLVGQTTGVNFSAGELFVSSDGVHWTARSVPANGSIAISPEGDLWLAGGVEDAHVWRSADDGATWKEVTPTPMSDAASIAFGAPISTSSGVYIAASMTSSPSLVTIFAATAQGLVSQASIRTGVELGPGTVLPATADPSGASFYVASGGVLDASHAGSEFGPVAASGLDGDIVGISFASPTNGWVVTDIAGCNANKQDCHDEQDLFSTTDAGATWTRLYPGF